MARAITDPLRSRPVPAFDPLAAFFWESGADDQLRILRCGGRGFYIHPPSHPCPQCFSAELAPTVVSGDCTVATCTVNVQQWVAGQQPYSIAIVELDEQHGLRLTSNVVGCDPNEVHIGQRVRVSPPKQHLLPSSCMRAGTIDDPLRTRQLHLGHRTVDDRPASRPFGDRADDAVVSGRDR